MIEKKIDQIFDVLISEKKIEQIPQEQLNNILGGQREQSWKSVYDSGNNSTTTQWDTFEWSNSNGELAFGGDRTTWDNVRQMGSTTVYHK